MTITPMHKEWIEIWAGTPVGGGAQRWLVDYCVRDGGKLNVADYATEAEARAEAAEWELPIIRV